MFFTFINLEHGHALVIFLIAQNLVVLNKKKTEDSDYLNIC